MTRAHRSERSSPIAARRRQDSRIAGRRLSVRRVTAGLVSMVVTLAGLAGAPILLYRLGRPLLPNHLPRWSELSTALVARDPSGRVFAVALLALGAAAWLTFAVSVVVELVARVANCRTWNVPGLGTQQRWAATLITAIALTFASPGAVALAAPLGGPAAVSVGTQPAPPAAATSADHDASVLVYRVQRGDYLGSIAARFEGEFGAYHRIASANHIDNPRIIHTGQRIELPAGVRDRGVRPHATGRIVEAAAGTGGGATTGTPAGGNEPGAGQGGAEQPGTGQGGAEQPGTGQSEATGSGRPSPGSAASTASGDGAVGRTVDALAVAGTLAALIAAGAAAVKNRDRLQRRLIRPGTVGAPPPFVPAARRAPQPVRLMEPPRRGELLRLDAALRTLADQIGGWPVDQLPQIVGAYLDHGDITLMLAAETEAPPEPFVVLDTGWWFLPADAVLPAAPSALAPLPSLGTVGGRADQHVLLDLEYLRVLSLSGDRAGAMDLLRYLVADLCHNVWSDDLRVCIAGFDPAEADQLRRVDEQRIRVISSVPDALDRFSRRFDLGIDTWGRPDEAPPNDVLFIADPSDEDLPLIRDFEQVLHDAPGIGMSVVVAPTPMPLARYHGDVSPGGTLSLDWLGSKTPAASLPGDLMAQVNVQIRNHRDSGDNCPLNVSRAASQALRRASPARPARLSGQHRRPKGEPAQTWGHHVDLMRARHARSARAATA